MNPNNSVIKNELVNINVNNNDNPQQNKKESTTVTNN